MSEEGTTTNVQNNDAAVQDSTAATPVATDAKVAAKSAAYAHFQPGVKVWAKLRGYPWWPAQILRPDQIPWDMRKSTADCKPPTDHQAVLFFGERSYSYVHMDSLQLYNDENNKKFQSKRTQRAMEEAETPGLFDDFTVGDEEVVEQFIPSDSEVAAEGSSKTAAKKQRKKRAATEGDEGGEKKRRASSSGKRAASKKAQPPAAQRPMYEGRPANERLLHFRHRLQRIFLASAAEDAVPVMRVDEFPIVDRVLAEVETFPELTVDLLKETKIGKVIKRITQLRFPLKVVPYVAPAADGSKPPQPEPVTVDEPANLVKRSIALLEQWRKMLSSSPAIVAAATTGTIASTAAVPATNPVETDEKENKSGAGATDSVSTESLNQAEQAEASVASDESSKTTPTTTEEAAPAATA